MVPHEQETALLLDMESMLQRYRLEFDLTHLQMLGVVELVKARLLFPPLPDGALQQQNPESEQARLERLRSESLAEATTAYPDLLREGSELSEAVAEELEYLQAVNSPILKDPNYPKLVIRRVARLLGIRPAGE